jgi:hypothetical protein
MLRLTIRLAVSGRGMSMTRKAAVKPNISTSPCPGSPEGSTNDDKKGSSPRQTCTRSLIRELVYVFIDPRVPYNKLLISNRLRSTHSDAHRDRHAGHEPERRRLHWRQYAHEQERRQEDELGSATTDGTAAHCTSEGKHTSAAVTPYGFPFWVPGAPMYHTTIPTTRPTVVPVYSLVCRPCLKAARY